MSTDEKDTQENNNIIYLVKGPDSDNTPDESIKDIIKRAEDLETGLKDACMDATAQIFELDMHYDLLYNGFIEFNRSKEAKETARKRYGDEYEDVDEEDLRQDFLRLKNEINLRKTYLAHLSLPLPKFDYFP